MDKDYKVAGPMELILKLPNGEVGRFRLKYFEFPNGKYYVIEKETIAPDSNPLVRVVSACSIGHIFNSVRCDCRAQLDLALEKIEEDGLGLLIYALDQEGRGIGHRDHVRVWTKQDEGFDTVDAYLELGLPIDNRRYDGVIEIIKSYSISSLRLLTNNPKKLEIFEGTCIKVERVSLEAKANEFNKIQLETKRTRLGHLL